jgi:hypothetical protein
MLAYDVATHVAAGAEKKNRARRSSQLPNLPLVLHTNSVPTTWTRKKLSGGPGRHIILIIQNAASRRGDDDRSGSRGPHMATSIRHRSVARPCPAPLPQPGNKQWRVARSFTKPVCLFSVAATVSHPHGSLRQRVYGLLQCTHHVSD